MSNHIQYLYCIFILKIQECEMIKRLLTLFFPFANLRTCWTSSFLIRLINVQVPWLVQIDVLEWRAEWTCLGLDNGVMWRPNDKPTIMRCQLTIGQINQNGPNSTRFAYGGSGGGALNCRPTVFGFVWPALGHVPKPAMPHQRQLSPHGMDKCQRVWGISLCLWVARIFA